MKIFQSTGSCPVVLKPEQNLVDAIKIMIEQELVIAPVVNDSALVGLLNLATALKWSRVAGGEHVVRNVMETEITPYNEGDKFINTYIQKIMDSVTFGIIVIVAGQAVKEVVSGSICNEVVETGMPQYSRTELSRNMLEHLRNNQIVVESPGMIKSLNLVMRAARTDVNVLILGESGVGKEVVARVIHNISQRSSTGSFIKINCGAIPENLLESELFGYEPGAFTGASPKGKPGMFEIAHHGTLLLDEIGDLPLNLQVKLLRFLQEQEVYRIGATRPVKLNVRIIAATNRNIWELVQKGSFREDLFYRLNVFPIEVPPLRDRTDDILPLVRHFILQYNEKYGMNRQLSPQAISILEGYDWPGNVRELQNLLERLLVVSDAEVISPDQVQMELNKFRTQFNSPVSVNNLLPLNDAKEILERQLLTMAFDCYPTVRKVAEVLGLDHSNVVRKAAKYGIRR